MNKELLYEILRMQNLSNYDKFSSEHKKSSYGLEEQKRKIINYLVEQDVSLGNLASGVSGKQENQMSLDEDYLKIEIGPANNPKYPTMLDVKTAVITNPHKEPSIKQFNSETTVKNFLPSNISVKTFKEGDKLSNGKPAPVGVEYFEKADGKKYCLPSAEWVKLHTDKRYVYQFTNQKTGEVFGLKFQLNAKQNYNGVEYSGAEISQMCPGGNNGWIFFLDPNTTPVTMFYNRQTGKPYDPTKDANNNSDFDDWWEEWKLWVEIGVGVLAGFLTGGLVSITLGVARILLTVVEAASIIGRVARFIIFLGESSFMGGASSWLRVLGGVFLEAGMMTPIALEYMEEGDENAAIMAWAFSFLPFLTELPAVARFIKSGRFTKGEADVVSNEILTKMRSAGGYKTITNSIESEYTFVAGLSEKAKDVYMGVKRLAVEKPNTLKEGFELSIKNNADKIYEAAQKSSNPTVKTAWQKANNMLNPLPAVAGGGKGFVPVIARAFMVVTPIALGSMIGLEYFKTLGLSEKVSKDLSAQVEKAYNSNQYWIDLASLNQSLGLSEQTTQQMSESLKTYMENNKAAIDEMINSDVAQQNFFKPEEVSKLAVKEAEKSKQVIVDAFAKEQERIKNDTQLISAMERLNISSKKNSLSIVIKGVGYNVLEWTNTSDPNKWTFTTDQNLNGEVVFNTTDNTYYVMVDNKKVT